MIKIRKAKVDDAQKIAQINVTVWKVAYKGLLPDDFLENRNISEERVQSVADRIKAPDSIYFVAEYEGKTVGFCNGGLPRDEGYPFKYEIRALYVLPEYQHKGIGKALVNEFEKAVCKQDFYLYTLKQNINAHKFYEKIGGILLPQYNKTIKQDTFEVHEVLFAFNYKDKS